MEPPRRRRWGESYPGSVRGKLVQSNAEVNAQDLASLRRARLPGEGRSFDENVDDAGVERDAGPRACLEVILASRRSVNVGGKIELVLSVDFRAAFDSNGSQREADHAQDIPPQPEVEGSGQVGRFTRSVTGADREPCARRPLESSTPAIPVPHDLRAERSASVLPALHGVGGSLDGRRFGRRIPGGGPAPKPSVGRGRRRPCFVAPVDLFCVTLDQRSAGKLRGTQGVDQPEAEGPLGGGLAPVHLERSVEPQHPSVVQEIVETEKARRELRGRLISSKRDAPASGRKAQRGASSQRKDEIEPESGDAVVFAAVEVAISDLPNKAVDERVQVRAVLEQSPFPGDVEESSCRVVLRVHAQKRVGAGREIGRLTL